MSPPLPELLQSVATGVVLGFSIAAPPGPVNATIASQTASRSWLAGLLVGLGAITADLIFFLLTFYGLTAMLVSGEVSSAVFLAGAAMMLFMARSTLKQRHSPPAALLKGGRLTTFPYALGLGIGITNPFQVAWWITVGLGVVSTFGLRILAGFFSGISAWVLIYTAILRMGIGRYYRVYPFVIYASAAVMVAFAAWFLLLVLGRAVF